MSGKKSRNKGAAGEREFFKLVEEHLGVKLRRNLSQYQENGLGDAEMFGFHLEIKRGKVYRSSWLVQAIKETPDNLETVLCYRIDRQPWKIKLPCATFLQEFQYSDYANPEFYFEVGLEAFFQIVRERM